MEAQELLPRYKKAAGMNCGVYANPKMKPPRAYLHFFGGIRRSTLLRSSSFRVPTIRIHPWAYAHGLLRRRI